MVQITVPTLFILGLKVEGSDLVHVFEDWTILKIPSEIKPTLLYMCTCAPLKALQIIIKRYITIIEL